MALLCFDLGSDPRDVRARLPGRKSPRSRQKQKHANESDPALHAASFPMRQIQIPVGCIPRPLDFLAPALPAASRPKLSTQSPVPIQKYPRPFNTNAKLTVLLCSRLLQAGEKLRLGAKPHAL